LLRGLARRNQARDFVSQRVNDHQYPTTVAHSQRYQPLFIQGIRILPNPRQWVEQHGRRFLEAYPMFLQIGGGFARISLKVHDFFKNLY
jgi:hypothetical protein